MFLWYNHKPCPTAGTARIPCEVQPLHFLSHYLFRYPFRCLSHCPYHPFPTHLFKQKLMWKGLFVLPLRAYGNLNHLMTLPSVSFQPSMMALKNIRLLKKKQHRLFTLWFFTLIILFFLVLEFELQQRRDEGSAWTTTTMSLGPSTTSAYPFIWLEILQRTLPEKEISSMGNVTSGKGNYEKPETQAYLAAAAGFPYPSSLRLHLHLRLHPHLPFGPLSCNISAKTNTESKVALLLEHSHGLDDRIIQSMPICLNYLACGGKLW